MSKLHIILYMLFVILLSSFVSAIPSTDRIDYYYNGSHYWTDGIGNTDIALNGSIPSNEDSMADFGWSLHVSGLTGNYTDNASSLGSLSMRFNATEGETYSIIGKNLPDFRGLFGYKLYITSSAAGAMGMVAKDGDDSLTCEYQISFPLGHYWRCSGCSCDTKALKLSTWNEFIWNMTDGENLYIYKNNGTGTEMELVVTYADWTGLGHIQFAAVDNAGTGTMYADEFWVSDTASRPEQRLVDNCSTWNITALNVSFIDFENGNPINISYKYSIDYTYDTTNANYSNSGTGNNFSLCLANSEVNVTGDLFIEYINNSILHTYYIEDIVLTNITQVITLRIAAGTTDVTATVYDQTNNLFEGVYIRYLKWDVDTNNYELMGIGKTNFQGETILPLVQNTELYKFMLYYPYETLRQTTVPSYITGTTLLFQISTVEDVATDFHKTMDVDTNLKFNNITNRFTWIYSDTNSVITNACLDVFKPTAKGFNQSISHDCLTTVSGVITSDVTRENGTTYCANAEVTLSGEDWFIDSLCYTYPTKDSNPAQYMGLLIAFIMTIAFAFAFKYSVELGIIALPLPALFCAIMGIIDIAVPVLIGIEIAAIVLAIILNRVID